jgi:hypothetical protein
MFARAREVALNESADRLRWIPAPASDRPERRWDDVHPVLPDTRKDGMAWSPARPAGLASCD